MIALSGSALSKVDRQDPIYLALAAAHPRLVKKDPTIWGPAAATEAAVRLNWVDLDESSRPLLPI
jgi:glucose-6-phosphate isomerase